MFKEEEEKLKQMRKSYEESSVPSEVDTYIISGIQKAKQQKKRRLRMVLSTASIVAIFTLFLISIRVSPVFASYVEQIPGMDRLVQLVQGDKGLESAVEHDYLQSINHSQTYYGVTLTIDDVIADESGMVIFYTLASEEKSFDYAMLEDTEILDENGERLHGSTSLGSHQDGFSPDESASGKIDVSFGQQTELPKEITMQTGVNVSPYDEVEEAKWEITFELDHEKFANNQEVYSVDKTVTIENQKITFKEMTVYPTQIGIHVQYDEANSKEIFSFDDLVVVDENGEERASILNGVTARHINDKEKILYLQSNYFDQPEELYIQFSSIRTLDKEDTDVVVDVNKGKLVKRPNNQLEIESFQDNGDIVQIEFLVKRDHPYDDPYSFYQIFGHTYEDEKGVEHEIENGTGTYTGEENADFISYLSLQKPDVGNTVTLNVVDYPTRITQETSIKVK